MPCLGTYTPKYSLIDKAHVYTFARSIKSVCEGIKPKKKKGNAFLKKVRNSIKFSNPNIKNIKATSVSPQNHMPNCKFDLQSGHKSIENTVNEHRFDFIPRIPKSQCKIKFNKIMDRPALFKLPEFLHEYNIDIRKTTKGKKRDSLTSFR